MALLYLVTGAAGNLGSHIVNVLHREGCKIRALVLEGDKNEKRLPGDIEIIHGDVRRREELEAFFNLPQDCEAIVIHAAGIVTIYPEFDQRVYDINVGGTRNITELCVEKRVRKLVYVSSVHAIPERPDSEMMDETTDFDPAAVEGFYAKTKAEASALVMKAVREQGLDASIVLPSGLCGPCDFSIGHITRLLLDSARGRMPVGVKGGYNFADVRDVAQAVVTAAQKGGAGESYILGNNYVSIRDILRCVHELTGARLIRVMFPVKLVSLFAPIFEHFYKRRRRTPLFTKYSLKTLVSNSNFSSEKAKAQLGYRPRPFRQTIADTLTWMKCEGLV